MGPRTTQDATAFDRVVALLTGLSLLCVFLMPSQSGASFPTYLVALLVLLGRTPGDGASSSKRARCPLSLRRAAAVFLGVGRVVAGDSRRAVRFRSARAAC